MSLYCISICYLATRDAGFGKIIVFGSFFTPTIDDQRVGTGMFWFIGKFVPISCLGNV